MDALRSEPRDVAEVALDLQRLQHVASDERNIVMEEVISLCRLCIQTKAAIYGLHGADADDFHQMVLTQIFRKIDTLQDPSRFIPWINRIAARMAINLKKRQKELHTFEDSTTEYVTQDPTGEPWQKMAESEKVIMLHQTISRLNDMDTEVLNLAYFQGLSMEEIAAVLNLPSATVRRRLHTARGRLKQLFSEKN